MSGDRDEADDMRPDPLDEVTADRLLAGELGPEDAPPGWSRVARLVRVASGPAEPDETAAESAVLAAMVDAILGETLVEADLGETTVGAATIVPITAGRRLSRFRTTRVAALAAAVVIVTATAAAAATGSLPRPAQTAMSDAAAHVGVSLPKPTPAEVSDHDADDAPPAAGSSPSSPTSPTTADHDPTLGAAVTSPAGPALCRSVGWARSGDPETTTGDYRALVAAATGARESVADFCRGLTHGHGPAGTVPAGASPVGSASVAKGGGHGRRGGEVTTTVAPSTGDQGVIPSAGSGPGQGTNQRSGNPGGNGSNGQGNGQGPNGQGSNGQGNSQGSGGPGNGGHGH